MVCAAGRFAVGFAYASTPFIFDAYVAGYTEMLVGIAVLPKALAAAHLAFETPLRVRNFLKGMVWMGLSAATVHLAILMVIMIAGYCAYRVVLTPGRLARSSQAVLYIIGMGLGFVFFHSAPELSPISCCHKRRGRSTGRAGRCIEADVDIDGRPSIQ